MDDLSRIARVVARLARVVERASASGDLSLPQYRVLATVTEGDERASLLASRLALAKPTITAVVDGLVERGLIERCDVAGDRRAVRLHITAAGRKALRTAEEAIDGALEALFARLDSPAETIEGLIALEGALNEAAARRQAEVTR
jgi:DNA-binding MarR family transcriptional regulator